MGVYKRKLTKGERWYYRGQSLGQKYHSRTIYLSKREAKQAERAHIQEIDEQIRNPVKDVSLVDLMNERLDYIKRKKSEKYYRENVVYFKMLLAAVGEFVLVSQVKKPHINQLLMKYAEELAQRGKTNHKANAALRCLKALFNYGIELYDLDIKNPVVGIKLYPVDIRLKYIPKDKEIEAVRSLCDEEQRLLIDFCSQTGCRINEAIHLRTSDIKEDSVVLYTRKARNSNLTPRIIPLPPCLVGQTFAGERVFTTWTDYPKFLEKKVKQLKQRRWGWHNLRHKYASELSAQGIPLFQLMSLLGHSNLKTTQSYLQLLGLSPDFRQK